MTTEEIVKIATQAAIAAVRAMGTQAPQVNNSASSRSDKPKALPDAKANAIGSIVAEATAEAAKNGKRVEAPKGTAIFMEYSEKQFALWGDTKEVRNTLKEYGAKKWGIIWGFIPDGCKEENKAEGWFFPKKNLEEHGGKTALFKALKALGVNVTEGASLKAKTEAHRAAIAKDKAEEAPNSAPKSKERKPKESKPKTEPKPKVIPIRIDEYEGIAIGTKKQESGVTFQAYPDEPDVFFREDKIYLCIGEIGGESAFLFVGKKVDGAVPPHIRQTAEDGILVAISKGIVTKVHQYIIDAFKALDDKSGYNWLVKEGYVKAA